MEASADPIPSWAGLAPILLSPPRNAPSLPSPNPCTLLYLTCLHWWLGTPNTVLVGRYRQLCWLWLLTGYHTMPYGIPVTPSPDLVAAGPAQHMVGFCSRLGGLMAWLSKRPFLWGTNILEQNWAKFEESKREAKSKTWIQQSQSESMEQAYIRFACPIERKWVEMHSSLIRLLWSTRLLNLLLLFFCNVENLFMFAK